MSIKKSEIQLDVNGRKVNAYLASPENGGPVVLVLHAWWGLKPFFKEFCPLVLESSACAQGYLHLDEGERAILRGALAVQTNADCSECPTGVDMPYADATVRYYAEGLVANCGQVGQTIFNATQSRPGMISTYEDLWRFTLANYNAGPGCLAFAIFSSWSLRETMNWENVSSHLTPPCQGVISYVDLITK